MFFRKSVNLLPPVTMSGVRMGERLLQVGIDDERTFGDLASKVGLSGLAAAAVPSADDAARASAAAQQAGVLVDVHTGALHSLPYEDASFDVVVVHAMRGLVSSLEPDARTSVLRELHRVLRVGGRLIVMEPGPVPGLRGLWAKAPALDAGYVQSGGAISALQAAGFRPVRLLGELEGFRFTEGLRT